MDCLFLNPPIRFSGPCCVSAKLQNANLYKKWMIIIFTFIVRGPLKYACDANPGRNRWIRIIIESSIMLSAERHDDNFCSLQVKLTITLSLSEYFMALRSYKAGSWTVLQPDDWGAQWIDYKWIFWRFSFDMCAYRSNAFKWMHRRERISRT